MEVMYSTWLNNVNSTHIFAVYLLYNIFLDYVVWMFPLGKEYLWLIICVIINNLCYNSLCNVFCVEVNIADYFSVFLPCVFIDKRLKKETLAFPIISELTTMEKAAQKRYSQYFHHTMTKRISCTHLCHSVSWRGWWGPQ